MLGLDWELPEPGSLELSAACLSTEMWAHRKAQNPQLSSDKRCLQAAVVIFYSQASISGHSFPMQ